MGLLPALVVIGAYFLAGKLGITLTVAEGVVTPVWAPSGIAVAAAILYGYRIWPAVAFGAFLTNATSDVSLVTAAGIAVGNTAEALAAAYILRKTRFNSHMQRVRDVVLFVSAGLAAAALAATNGVTILSLAAEASWSEWSSRWLLWWFGDVVGIVLVAPVLLVWLSGSSLSRPLARHSLARAIEGAALLAALSGTSVVVFLGGRWQFPYLLFPLLIWAAIRFKQRGATLAMLIVGGIATWGTVDGAVALGDATLTTSVQVLQGLVSTMGVAIYMLAASLTERDAANERLAEAQELARMGSWEWDLPSGKVTWSDEMFRVYGYEPRSMALTFERAMERVLPEDAERIAAGLRETFEGGTDRSRPPVEYRIELPDGSIRTLRGRGTVFFADGRPIRAVGTVEDVTDDVAAQLALKAALEREQMVAEELRNSDEMKNTFISAVSHDLRTPIAVITGFTQTLLRQKQLTKEEIQDFLARIDHNAGRAQSMLTNLLDLDRVSRSSLALSSRLLDVSEIVSGVLDVSMLSDHPVHRSLESIDAQVDPVLVERMVENLVVNAIRHTPVGTDIWVSVRTEGSDVLILVEDAGAGVPDAHKESIFEVFTSGASERSGSGIGLHLVKTFATLHGGTAWVEDRAGGGASFRIRLPRGPTEDPAPRLEEPRELRLEELRSQEPRVEEATN